jgi:hypothetical protein
MPFLSFKGHLLLDALPNPVFLNRCAQACPRNGCRIEKHDCGEAALKAKLPHECAKTMHVTIIILLSIFNSPQASLAFKLLVYDAFSLDRALKKKKGYLFSVTLFTLGFRLFFIQLQINLLSGLDVSHNSFPRLFSSTICLSGTCGELFIEAISAFLDFT